MFAERKGSSEISDIDVEFPGKPWQRLHIDYAGPFFGSMWLVWIDSYSKYGGVERVKNADGLSTVRKLTEIFALFGNPEVIVSDNGTPFTSSEFGELCKTNGIKHIRSAPYHPSTNGEAERFVQVFKRALRPHAGTGVDTQLEVTRFLQRYRTIPHSTTGRTPSELLLGRTLRTTLDLMRPHVEQQVQSQQTRTINNYNRTVRNRDFCEGQPVFARHYIGPRKWVGGVIARRSGPLSYDVQVGDQLIARHASQLLANRSGHLDLSDSQRDELLDVTPSKSALEQKPEVPAPALATPARREDPAEAVQPAQVAQPKFPEAPEKTAAAVAMPARTLRPRETLKPSRRFDEEFS